MKKNRTTRLIVFALLLAIITSIIISGTFAKYTESTPTENGTAQIAKWSFSADGLDSVVRTDGISLDMIAKDQLAPGTSGTIDLELDFTGCEVAVEHEIEVAVISNYDCPINLMFDYNYGFSIPSIETAVNPTTGSREITKKIKGKRTLTVEEIAALEDGKLIVPVTWSWPYETTSGDSTDTSIGKFVEDIEFSVKITATQANPNA